MSDMKGYPLQRLGELVSGNRGVSYKPENLKTAIDDNSVVLLRSNNIQSGTLNFENVQIVPDSLVSDSQILKKGDIAVCMSNGSRQLVGKSGMLQHEIEYPLTVGAFCSVFRCQNEDDSEYVRYLFQSQAYQHGIDVALAGSAINNLKNSDIEAIEVPTAPKKLRKKIAEILSTIDNQIGATQALIDKYTAIKQGMMADLFSRGIDPETKALRPTFEEAPELYHKTPLGMLPKEWDVVELQTVATVERGKFTHRPRDDKRCFGGGYPFIQTGDVAACVGNHLTQYKQTLSDFGRSVSKEFPVGTVAVTIAANIADTAILAMPMCFPDSVVGVVVDERLSSSRFVELCIRMSKAKLDALAPQSAQKNINLEDLRPLKLPFPSRVEQELVCSSYEAINDPINSLFNEKKKLIAQKSGLMQDLLTGKVPVPA